MVFEYTSNIFLIFYEIYFLSNQTRVFLYQEKSLYDYRLSLSSSKYFFFNSAYFIQCVFEKLNARKENSKGTSFCRKAAIKFQKMVQVADDEFRKFG